MREERINSIIQRRKPMAERINEVRENLTQSMEQFGKFCTLCRTVMQDKDTASELSGLRSIAESSDSLLREARDIRDSLSNIQNRLLRNTLNIAVIGRARQGKSKLLQTITGLGHEEIPDGSLSFCTGVRSDMINDPALQEAYAIVHFLTEERFIDENVAPYFTALQMSAPISVSEFRSCTIPELGSMKASQYEDATQMNLHLHHLQDLQKHLPQYQEYLGRSPLKITRSEIREYVAQDNDKGERIYFNHMAVDRVEIFCRFPNADIGALRLIDLPGLGDTRIGDVERVVRALRDQVDLVLFLTKPSNSGAGWEDKEVNLYGSARRALGEKLPIERWAFWVFNRDSRKGADNLAQCELLRDTINEAQITVADTVIADCTSNQEVSEKIIDKALEHLAGNIERNDREYAENIQSALTGMMQRFREAVSQAQAVLRDEESFDDMDSSTFDTLFDDLWDELREKLQESVEEDSELRMNRENPCLPLKERIEAVLDEEDNSEVAVSAEDFRKLKRRFGGLMRAYEDYLHQLRTGLSRKMQQNLDDILDSVLTKTKDAICSILGTTGRLEKHFGVKDHRLLGEVIAFIEASGYSDGVPTLMEGFRLVDGWTMSYRSFIQHRIRSSLNVLDPLEADSKLMGDPRDETQAVENLRELYRQTVYTLRKEFDGIYSEPNKAAFAVAEEFKDIMIRPHETKNAPRLENQWRKLYRSIKGDIWPEEYGSTQKKRDVCARLRVPLMNVVSLLDKNNFSFLS